MNHVKGNKHDKKDKAQTQKTITYRLETQNLLEEIDRPY